MVTWTIPEDTINLDAEVVITGTVFSSAICYLSSQNTKLLMYYQNLAGCNSLLIYHVYSVLVLCVRVRCQRRRTQDTMWYKVTQHWQQPSYALTTRARESLLSVSISKQWILWLATVEFITITALNVNTELRETVVPRKIDCSGLILNASDSSFSILTKTEQWRHQHCFCLGLKTEDWCVSHFVTIIS